MRTHRPPGGLRCLGSVPGVGKARSWVGGAALALLAGCHPGGLRGPGPAALLDGAHHGGEPREAAPMSFVLDNGLRVVLQEDHSARVIALQATAEVGAADDPDDLPGLAHIFEHTLFLSTQRRAPGAIAREIEAAGGQWTALTSPDQTVFRIVVASRFLDTGLDLLADGLQNATFDDAELSRELSVLRDELRQAEGEPTRVATESLFAAAYTRHPYRHPVLGAASTLSALTQKTLREHYLRDYMPGNLTLVLCGDFDTESARHKIAAAFGGMGGGRRAGKIDAPLRKQEPEQHGLRVVTSEHGGKNTQLLLGFHIPNAAAPETAALDVAAALLGGGEGSRLAVEVQKNRGVVNATYAYSFTPREPGMMVIGARLSPGQLGAAAAALLGEVFRLSSEEVSGAELSRAVMAIEADGVRERETAAGRAARLSFFASAGGGAGHDAAYVKALHEVTPDRLRQIVSRYLVPDNLTLSVSQPRHGDSAETDSASLADKGRVERLMRGLVAQAASKDQEYSSAVLPRRPGAASADSSSSAAQDPRDGVVVHRLRGGVKLLILPERGVQLVALSALWSGDLRDEDERSAGASHLLASLLPRGTRTRSAEELRRELAEVAGTLAGVADENSFGLRVEALSQGLPQALAVLSDCLKNPALPDTEVETERRKLLERLHTEEDSGEARARRLFLRALFPHHFYGQDPLGTPQSVATLSRRRLLEFYQRHYPLDKLTLAVVGDVQPQQVIERAEALLGSDSLLTVPPVAAAASRKTPGAAPGQAKDDLPPHEPIQVFKSINKQQAHLILGFRGVAPGKAERADGPALDVVTAVLGGPGGRLRTELHDRRGLAYRVGLLAMTGVAGPGYVAVQLATSPERAEAAQAAARDELRKLCDHPVSEDELVRARRYLIGVHELGLQRRAGLAFALALHEANGLPFHDVLDYADRIQKISVADVQRVARRYLDEDHAVLAAVLPESLTPAAARRTLRESSVTEPDPRPPAVADEGSRDSKRTITKRPASGPKGRR